MKESGGDLNVHLEPRQVFLLLFAVLILVVLSFGVGYLVGRRAGAPAPLDDPPAELARRITPVPALDLPTPVPAVPTAQPEAPPVEEASLPEPVPTVREMPTPAPTPRAPSAPAPTAKPVAGPQIQVGAFGERSQAQAVMAKLARGGYAVILLPPAGGEKAKLYRVRVGPFPSRAAAEKALASLKAGSYPKAYIVKEP